VSTSYEIDYLLPVTAVQFDIVTTVTTVDGGTPETSKTETVITADVSVVTEGDTRYPQCARIVTGWINDVDATLTLLPELRLSSVTAESTGRLGELVAAGVKLAATVAGVTLTAPRKAVAHRVESPPKAKRIGPDTAELDTRIATLRSQIKAATAEIEKVAQDALGTADLRVALRRIALLKALRASEESELGLVVAARDSLIALSTKTTRSTGTRSLAFDLLPKPAAIDNGSVVIDELGSAKALWDETGLVVTATPEAAEFALKGTDATGAYATAEGVFHRVPRKMEWTLWRSVKPQPDGKSDPKVERVSQGISWVVDLQSKLRFVKFRRSWWAKRKAAIDFAADGTASKLTVGATSSAASITTALGTAPQTFSDALTTVKSIAGTSAELADRAAKERLDDLTRAYDTRAAELKNDAQDLTAGDYAELERLKQQVALAEQRAALAPATSSPTAVAQAELERYLVESVNSRRDEISAGSVENVAALLKALRD